MMRCSEENTGASFEHYSIYKFWELDENTPKEYFTKRDADTLRKKYNNRS